ncbi:molybdenum cofactor guanylyltransferase [Castellaniella sp. GW247-6E4]|uniref:molybdenum cofactor guanylyltransferase n=1 Tax=Castellaniella sp. GW247-6E4 TaxID=3140380 RepID=UPI0033158544
MAEAAPPAFTGLVLAGGRSSRLGGDGVLGPDKGLAPFQGEPLVSHACRYLRGQGAGAILISANRHAQDYRRYGRVVADPPRFGAFQGPLLGVAAALEATPDDWLLTVPVDVLALPADMADRLMRAADAGHPAYACTPDGPHPLCLLAPRGVAADLSAWLADGGRKVQDWLARVGARPVGFEGGGFLNLNTPEDWHRAGACPP